MKIQSFWFRGSTPFPATLIVGKDTVVCMDALRAKFTRSSLIFPSHEGRGDKPGFTESVFRSTSWLATLHLSFRMLAMHPTKEGYYQHTYSSKCGVHGSSRYKRSNAIFFCTRNAKCLGQAKMATSKCKSEKHANHHDTPHATAHIPRIRC